MKNLTINTSPRNTARVAGLLYLMVVVFGIFAEMAVRSNLIVPGDATATANNIIASESLFRMGIVSDLIMMTCSLLLPLVLYKLFKPVSKNHALLMVVFILVSVPIVCLNMLNQFAALLLLKGADYFAVFNADQLHALVMFFLDLHKHGYLIAQIFFGLWLLPLGFLVFKSGYFPRILGVLLMIASVALLIDFLLVFLFPNFAATISPIVLIPGAIAEISFCLWLLFKGVKVQQPAARAAV